MNRLPRINAVLKFGQRACRLVPTGTVPARIVLVLTPKSNLVLRGLFLLGPDSFLFRIQPPIRLVMVPVFLACSS